ARRSTKCSSPSPAARPTTTPKPPEQETTMNATATALAVDPTIMEFAPSATVHAPSRGATAVTTASTVAVRTLPNFARTPQLIVVGALTSAMFLLIFRYVFGGAIGTGGVEYVDYLIPGLAAAGALFSGMGGAVGVAEDIDRGLFDRFRSLPVPRSAVL